MTNNPVAGQLRILFKEDLKHRCETRILYLSVGKLVCAFQFYADTEIIAVVLPVKRRAPGMPGAPVKGHKLNHAAISPDKQMRGNLKTREVGKICMQTCIQMTAEKRLNIAAGKVPGGQAHIVQYHGSHPVSPGPLVLMAGGALLCTAEPAMAYGLRPGVCLLSGSWFQGSFALTYNSLPDLPAIPAAIVNIEAGKGQGPGRGILSSAMKNRRPVPPDDLEELVQKALAEDIGGGDVTAELIPESQICTAEIICREKITLCGAPWAEAVFRSLDAAMLFDWQAYDGDQVAAGSRLLRLEGSARAVLTGERSALNFLQTLSATASAARYYADLLEGQGAKLLDTRKTVPGLRSAQKYAVACGGGQNHRQGLYDAYLIKENHIAAAGGIASAIETARRLHPELPLEIEVETFAELREAKAAAPDIIMLDNFSVEDLCRAVRENNHPIRFEASGGIESETDLLEIAASGVDYISIGALTKHIRAPDLSLRILETRLLLQ